MWTCPNCGQEFKNTNQSHSCGETQLQDFFRGKSADAVLLFWHFVRAFQKLGPVSIHPTKSMIAFAATTRIAYVIQLGEKFVDFVFPLSKAYPDNLCFRKIALVPGSQQYNHHFRILNREDINAEVKKFMKLALERGK